MTFSKDRVSHYNRAARSNFDPHFFLSILKIYVILRLLALEFWKSVQTSRSSGFPKLAHPSFSWFSGHPRFSTHLIALLLLGTRYRSTVNCILKTNDWRLFWRKIRLYLPPSLWSFQRIFQNLKKWRHWIFFTKVDELSPRFHLHLTGQSSFDAHWKELSFHIGFDFGRQTL